MIHASGDVDYGHLIATSKGAVAAGIDALAKGCNIYTDVNMVKAGINKNALSVLGGEVFCRVSDPEIAKIAKEKCRALPLNFLPTARSNRRTLSISRVGLRGSTQNSVF